MPADSDDDYIQTYSDDEDSHQVNKGKGRSGRSGGGSSKRAGGFEVSRTWEALEEGADGTITGAIEGLLEASKRKRYVFYQLIIHNVEEYS
jgi:transcription initiation factor TFIIH subunit 2